MALTARHDNDRRRRPAAGPGWGPPGPLVWQRTDTVGTELVFQSGPAPVTATGSAVVAGPVPHMVRWHAEVDTEWTVRSLTVMCDGADWSRTVRLAAERDGSWRCRTDESGDLGASLAGSGHPAPPLPGVDDAGRLAGGGIVRVANSPIFLTWAVRRLGLVAGGEPVRAPTVRVLVPSLVVVPSTSTYQLVTEHRLRVGGDEPSAGFDLDDAGIVTYRPARLRLAR